MGLRLALAHGGRNFRHHPNGIWTRAITSLRARIERNGTGHRNYAGDCRHWTSSRQNSVFADGTFPSSPLGYQPMILRRSHPDDKLIVVSREITVQNELGLHARPAAEFVRVANSFRSEITLIKNNRRFLATSLIDVLRANLDRGATAMLEARGADAEAAITRLEKLLVEFRDRKED